MSKHLPEQLLRASATHPNLPHDLITQARDFDAQYGEITPGVTYWEKLSAYIFTPMLLTVAILLKTRHQFGVFGRDASSWNPDGACILNIERRFLPGNINEALQNPVRRIPDQMPVAVIPYGVKHGTGERYCIHMRGSI
jgi:hypothetical protein